MMLIIIILLLSYMIITIIIIICIILITAQATVAAVRREAAPSALPDFPLALRRAPSRASLRRPVNPYVRTFGCMDGWIYGWMYGRTSLDVWIDARSPSADGVARR